MFIRTDKISDILNDLVSDGGSFSELSDNNTCEVNSPFSSSSSSEEEEDVQPEPDRGRKRTRKGANTDFELGWKEQIQTVQKATFSRVPGINKNLHTTQDSSPREIYETFFNPDIFKLIQKETNWNAPQQINKKKQEGPLKPKSVFAQWNRVPLQEIKKFFRIILHVGMLRKSSVRDYWSSHSITHTPYAASVGMSQDRFLALFTLFHLNNNDAKPAGGQPGCDPQFKIQPVIDTSQNFRMSTHWKNTWLSTRQCIHFEGIYSFVLISEESPTNMGQKCLNFVWKKAATSTTWKYILGHIPPTQNTTQPSVLLTGCVIK